MRLLTVAILLVFLTGCSQRKPVNYQAQIQPILNTHCVRCHSTEKPTKKINLSSYALMTASRASISGKQPLVIPGSPAESRLYVLCATNQAHFRMPPDTSSVTPLPVEELELLKKWIEQGAREN
jgi:uncharacterized membrane protein